MEEADRPLSAEVLWEGDSLEVLRGFPKSITRSLGREIQRLQEGERPLDSRPMQSIGQGVFELRQADKDGWYRVIYLRKVGSRLFVLHSFVKKSAKTSAKDLSIARFRLQAVQARLLEEKKDAKKRNK
ncbi:type II toxin-antitoxin system RelE/ParE family toxin [Aeoliella sp.]|uniref:type II toxin-antitoxin system RelE/ParE family toxin n=1 Tax=Aeoliella sp. TaxID=2795800 RepID=UPI003CCC1C2F